MSADTKMLTLSAVMESSQAVVAEYGHKHWTRPRGNRIHMLNPDSDEPEDLVGHTLTRLGASIPLDMAGASIHRLVRKGVVNIDDEAYEFLLVLQDAQDDGDLWIEALILAECWMIEKGMPWNQAGYVAA